MNNVFHRNNTAWSLQPSLVPSLCTVAGWKLKTVNWKWKKKSFFVFSRMGCHMGSPSHTVFFISSWVIRSTPYLWAAWESLRFFCANKRVRPDMLTAIAFPTTRVTKSQKEDFDKRLRVIQYIRAMHRKNYWRYRVHLLWQRTYVTVRTLFTGLDYTVLYCTMLYCTVLYCTVLYCTV